MKLLNADLRIYSSDMTDLTFGQIRSIQNFRDDEPISQVSAFYDEEKDYFIINSNCVEEIYQFCEAGLSQSAEVLQRKLSRLHCRIELMNLIIHVRIIREEKEQEKQQAQVINPNTKFVSVGEDVFQISKIVSTKKRDESGRFYIEVFVTNKRASIKKEFRSKTERDLEFTRVQRVLVSAA